MNRFDPRKGLGAALAALLATGCDPAPNPSAPPVDAPMLTQTRNALTSELQFCADSVNYVACDPISFGPQYVYNQITQALLQSCGSNLMCLRQGIRVWATNPGFDASPEEFQAWLQAQQQAIDFLKSTNRSAESLYESMKIHDSDNKRQLSTQERTIATASDRLGQILLNAETTVREKALAYRDPLVIELTDAKAGLATVDRVVAETRTALEVLSPRVVDLANQFKTFKGTEAATVDELRTLASQGSTASLTALVTLQIDAVALAQRESSHCSALILEAARLRSQLSQLEGDYTRRLEPHRAFIDQRGLQMGDLVRGEQAIVGGIEGYSETRRRKVLSAVEHLLTGLRQRRDALIGLEADAATRQALADAAFLDASQHFLDEATANSAQLWQVPRKSTRLKLSFLSEKYDQMSQYLQFEPACAPPPAGQRSWREAGCAAMRMDFSRVRTYLSSTLPGTLRLQVAMMRQAGGVPAELLTDVEAKLATGQLKAAATVHDAALRASDGL